MRLERGKVAVVTGAASGIGLALAERFIAAGMHVVAADVEEPRLNDMAERLGGAGSVLPVVTDVRHARAVHDLAATAIDAFGAVHVVCNNAGVSPITPLVDMTPDDWQWVIEVNLLGVAYGIATFAPLLVAQGEGHIVNTASEMGLVTSAGFGPYAATKHAVVRDERDTQLRARANRRRCVVPLPECRTHRHLPVGTEPPHPVWRRLRWGKPRRAAPRGARRRRHSSVRCRRARLRGDRVRHVLGLHPPCHPRTRLSSVRGDHPLSGASGCLPDVRAGSGMTSRSGSPAVRGEECGETRDGEQHRPIGYTVARRAARDRERHRRLRERTTSSDSIGTGGALAGKVMQ